MSRFKVFINSQDYQTLIDMIGQSRYERFACLLGRVERIDRSVGTAIVIREIHVLEDEDYLGFYDEDHRLMIDQNMAAVIAELSDPHELFCIDNDYNLKVHAVDIGDGFFDDAPGEK